MNKKMKFFLGLIVCILLLSILPAMAADIVADFSKTANPNGQWNYGYITRPDDPYETPNVFTLFNWWEFAGPYWTTRYQTPYRGIVGKHWNDPTKVDIIGGYWGDDVDWMICHDIGAVGWKSNSTGNYNVNMQFRAWGYDSRVYVIKQSIDGSFTYLNENGSAGKLLNEVYGPLNYTYSGTVALAADEIVYFAHLNAENLVGRGLTLGTLVSISGTIEPGPAGSSLTGTVNLSDFGGDVTNVPVMIELNGTPHNLNLDAENKFTIMDVADGPYDIRIKASHWLAKAVPGVNVAGNTDIGSVTLINGDVVDTNEVDFDDINATRTAYGSFPGDETWNDMADVDGSGEIDFTDINIVRGKYGEIGD
jgi:hypothetical protein